MCFDFVDESSKVRDCRFQFGFDGLTFASEFHERLRVVDLTRYFPVEGERFLEPSALLKSFAGTVLVGPEAGIADYSLQFIELSLAGTGVKGTSGRLRSVF